jgi:hypothetical protein
LIFHTFTISFYHISLKFKFLQPFIFRYGKVRNRIYRCHKNQTPLAGVFYYRRMA